MSSRRPVPPRDAGFTLLEVLVAVFILGMVLTLLVQGVQFGIEATRLHAAAREQTGDLHAIDRALRRLVALADPGIYPEPATLRGAAGSLSFLTELPLHGPGQTQRADVVLSAVSGQLVLRWAPHRHADLFGAAPAWQTTVLLDGVERIELAYRSAGANGRWSAAWTAEKLPSLIRIGLVFRPGSKRRWPPIVAAPVREAIEE